MNFHPTRNKRTAPSVQYSGGRWEVQPRRYYDTVNVVIILKVCTRSICYIASTLKQKSEKSQKSVDNVRIANNVFMWFD